jgi:Raf kinase inhibitor-like YbhB/YbcL family protein
MMKHVPHVIGRALKNVRPGLEKTLYFDECMADVPELIRVESTAFGYDGLIPVRYTADGEKLSPPLAWTFVPPDAVGLVLLIEDADSPTPQPLTHAILLDLPPSDGKLAEGELRSPEHDGVSHDLGRNSLRRARYLPPDPPPGHGEHRYVFQVFAVDRALLDLDRPSKRALKEALTDHVLARGCLIGCYRRE